MSSKTAPRRVRNGSARDRAADVLVRVETEGAFAAPALASSLEREPALSAADRGLCTELVYGVLRTASALDARLAAFASKPGSIAALDAYTRAVLRIAAYQVLVLERVPSRAAVNAAVDAVSKDRSKGLSGFVNALLRKVAAGRDESQCARLRVSLALDSVDPSVRAALSAGLGSAEDAESVLRAMFERTPSTDVRAERTRIGRDELERLLREERPGAGITHGKTSPLSLRVSGAGDLRTSPLYRERGLFAVQEEGAQCVALATGVRPGMRVLDACAGRGGKTALLASMLRGEGLLHAADAYPEKVQRGRDELVRLGLLRESLAYEAVGADVTRGVGALASKAPEGGYDLVLVDAPCSGLGTLARRPDLLARRLSAATSDDDGDGDTTSAPKARLAIDELQRAILRTSAGLVRPGGELVFAVCTLTHAEGAGMLEWFLRETAGAFEPHDAAADRVEIERLRPSLVTLRPDRDETDGFVLWRARKRDNRV
jgi:16S rRNA (cytosine967-C5)-methyltransferase